MAKGLFAALDRAHELYRQTGRKLLVANFANALIAILAPTARRLMCDISPCGGGRAFFSLAADGSLYPCSEFIGLPRFSGGNLLDEGAARLHWLRRPSAPSPRATSTVSPRATSAPSAASAAHCARPRHTK